ncbi:uncharacterized protein QC763_510180 [Podospora pseudopauciseta]|uniref:Uncharacterized protein n=1 Tax=Podospora pseudopauciseta TaxID=2093780 RepID=A0ABR0HB27_9PEZI|nr:hypothetical protein QC763_510180 [Podospora pseudopauciseta]
MQEPSRGVERCRQLNQKCSQNWCLLRVVGARQLLWRALRQPGGRQPSRWRWLLRRSHQFHSLLLSPAMG